MDRRLESTHGANCPGPGDGSAGNPFCLIQDAINAAADQSSSSDGGAMYNTNFSNTFATGCTFQLNSVGDKGGAVANTAFSDTTFDDCLFDGNSAKYGGAMYNDQSGPTLIGCVWSNNIAFHRGGAVYTITASFPTLLGCDIETNVAGSTTTCCGDGWGGASYGNGGSLTFTDCTFLGNLATGFSTSTRLLWFLKTRSEPS